MERYRGVLTTTIQGGAASLNGRSEWWRPDGGRPFSVPWRFARLLPPNVCLENGDMLEPDADAELDMLDPQPPRGPLADNQTPGNVTRDRLAAIVSGNEQDPF